jgi:hypothetical protein
MRNPFVRYGKPWLALIAMAIIFGCSQVLLFVVAKESGWATLAGAYSGASGSDESGSRIPGKLVLGGFGFDIDTAAAYDEGSKISIRATHAKFFLTFLHFPDLSIPKEKIAGDPTGEGAWISCNGNQKVFFRIKSVITPEKAASSR